MGQFEHGADGGSGANEYLRMDKRDIGDGPEPSELGSLRANSDRVRDIGGPDLSGGANPVLAGDHHDDTSERRRRVHGRRERLRLSGGASPALRRVFDAKEANSLFTATCAPESPMVDFSQWIDDRRNIFLSGATGWFAFGSLEFGVYECMAGFFRDKRGWEAACSARSAVDRMFVSTECERIICRLPASARASSRFCAHLGMKDLGARGGVRHWASDIDEWRGAGERFSEIGAEFVDEISAGLSGEIDGVAREELGRFAIMIQGGQERKAIGLYNRRAVIWGLPLAAEMSRSPLLIRLGSILLQLDGSRFKVVKT